MREIIFLRAVVLVALAASCKGAEGSGSAAAKRQGQPALEWVTFFRSGRGPDQLYSLLRMRCNCKRGAGDGSMTRDDQALKALRASGRRITSQRRKVLQVVEASPRHLDAEAIYLRARENDPQISLATVYRTLAVLKEMGLVEGRFLSRDHPREHFEGADTPEHYHFTCLSCGRITEFRSPRVAEVFEELERERGLSIQHACLCLEGWCDACRAENQASEE